MTIEAIHEPLLSQFRGYIYSSGAREALDHVTKRARTLQEFRCEPRRKGVIHDFRFYDAVSDEQPFALIVNRNSLLFYVRRPGLARLPGDRSALAALGLETSENKRGEITIRVASGEEATRLMDHLFPVSRTIKRTVEV